MTISQDQENHDAFVADGVSFIAAGENRARRIEQFRGVLSHFGADRWTLIPISRRSEAREMIAKLREENQGYKG